MKEIIRRFHEEFRRTEETRYIHRLHGVLLVLLGQSTIEAGKLLGIPQRTVAHWVIRYREKGLVGLRDPDRGGHHRKLNAEQLKTLAATIALPPSVSGLSDVTWTGILLSEFLKKTFAVDYTPRHCTRLLNTLRAAQS